MPAAWVVAVAVWGHGAVVNPPPRNAIDKDLSPWNGPMPVHDKGVGQGLCPAPDKSGRVTGLNGQACFWFSNGCAIGCKECDGESRGPAKYYPNMLHKFPICKNNTAHATICDPKLRTVNTAAKCGATDDWYYYSPWRAPGSAPVLDPCGMAGGTTDIHGKFGAEYVNTSHAKVGDLGSVVLPAQPSGTVWTRGSVVEVSWSIEANHGGGYQYRLAPKESPLTEATFQKMPLKFVGQQQLRWGGTNGTVLAFDGVYATEGTQPPGSAWAQNPIPRNDVQNTGQGFAPHCNTTGALGCQGMWDGGSKDGVGDNVAVPDLEIVDHVAIPIDLPAGDYILGWRYDCEESNQIWQSCSDVTISAHS